MDELMEKLLVLLDAAHDELENYCAGDCSVCEHDVKSFGCIDVRLAKHLITNGVTIQKWIPVSERVPTEADANSGGKVLAHRKEGHSDTFYWKTVVDFPEWFTHWMPTTELPKEV